MHLTEGCGDVLKLQPHLLLMKWKGSGTLGKNGIKKNMGKEQNPGEKINNTGTKRALNWFLISCVST